MTAHSEQDVLGYLRGDLSKSERARVEGHLKTCSRCRDSLVFVRKFNSVLKDMAESALQPDTPHPDAETLIAFQMNELDEKKAQSVRQHTAFCKDCLEELHLLCEVEELPRIKSRASVAGMSLAQWRTLFAKLRGTVIELGKKYDVNALIGKCRIFSESLRPLVIGEKSRALYYKRPLAASKAVKVGVGKNVYGIRLQTSDLADTIKVQVDTVRRPIKERLNISVHSSAGEELVTAHTDDKGGFSFFSVSGRSIPDELFLLTLRLKNSQRQVLFRAPLKKLSALSKLNYTERAIVRLLAEGYSTEEIRKKRSLDEQRLKDHLETIFATLGVSDMATLAHYAVDLDAVKFGE